jgi:hypothetical protein
MRIYLPVAVACVMSVSLNAQWLNHPSRGVPRMPDGKPNLSAPAPRTADGKPDFSGIWQLEPNAPCPALGCQVDYPVGIEFRNLGAKLPGGAVRKLIQLPDLVVILSERDVTYRQIFLDGRSLPSDPDPTFNGYSTGRWDGDVLLVQTNGLRGGMWLDRNGSPISEAAKMTERFRRVNYGRLEIDLTIDDPKTYTRPWTVTLAQRIVVDTELLDYHCNDNEKSAERLVGK